MNFSALDYYDPNLPYESYVLLDFTHNESMEGFAPPVVTQPINITPPSPPTFRRSVAGNNPYGRRGFYSCIRCRKRKGKVWPQKFFIHSWQKCEFKHKNDDCGFCQKYGHACGIKVTKSEFSRMTTAYPPIRYSALVADLEREFPSIDMEGIRRMAGDRLEQLKQNRLKFGITY